jgi:hypothetical protein
VRRATGGCEKEDDADSRVEFGGSDLWLFASEGGRIRMTGDGRRRRREGGRGGWRKENREPERGRGREAKGKMGLQDWGWRTWRMWRRWRRRDGGGWLNWGTSVG